MEEQNESITHTITFDGYSATDYTGHCFSVTPDEYQRITEIVPDKYDFTTIHENMATMYWSYFSKRLMPQNKKGITPTKYRFTITLIAEPLRPECL